MNNVLSKENLQPNIEDMARLKREELTREDINKAVDDMSFAGYGSSYESMIGLLPQSLELPYSEEMAYRILCDLSPDIAVVHCPPYGLCDGSKGKEGRGHMGSFGVLSYLLEKTPDVMLVGHNHSPAIGQKAGTIVINPGNLGRYGADNYGTFAELEMNDGNFFKGATFYKISDSPKGNIGVLAIIKPKNIGLETPDS